jgi:hypothetical protein
MRRVVLVVTLVSFACAPGRGAAQTGAAPLYSLPKDGTWVEYACTVAEQGGRQQTGTLRISSVGQTVTQGARYRWVEIKWESDPGGKQTRRIRKLQVVEETFARSRSLKDSVVAIFDQGEGGAVARMSTPQARAFLSLGLEVRDTGLKTRNVEKHEIRPGEIRTRQVSGAGDLMYDGWLTDTVPFGWSRFEIREVRGEGPGRKVFTAAVARTGPGARSEVDESKAK